MCGYPLPHDYQAPFGCILNSIQREGEAVIHSFHLGHFILRPPDQAPRGISSYQQCDFFTENFVRAYCNVEQATHSAVRKLIQPSDTVLEVGSRYATTTCEVAVRQNNSGKLIAVEPDHRVWAAAEVRLRTKKSPHRLRSDHWKLLV